MPNRIVIYSPVPPPAWRPASKMLALLYEIGQRGYLHAGGFKALAQGGADGGGRRAVAMHTNRIGAQSNALPIIGYDLALADHAQHLLGSMVGVFNHRARQAARAQCTIGFVS